MNAGTLVAAQALSLAVPLATIPFLARVLGPSAWGPVLVAQALANWLILVFEFAFDLSATRDVARVRGDRVATAAAVHGVQSAKLLLIGASIPIVLAGGIIGPLLGASTSLFLWAYAYSVVRGLNPLWFFQGIEQPKTATVIDTICRLLAALGVFVVVRSPDDGWRVLALQAVFSGLSLAILTTWMSRRVTLRAPELAAGLRSLRDGASIFAFRGVSGLYAQANTLLLSVLAAPAIVAFFGGADRIIRASINLLQPITQAFLPRVSHLQAADPNAASRAIRHALLGAVLFGVAVGTVAIAGAPLLIRILLGPEFSASIAVLRALGVLPLLVAINTVLGVYWALPFGHERALLRAIFWGGTASLGVAVLLVPSLGALGMASSAVLSEVVIFVVLATLYRRRAR